MPAAEKIKFYAEADYLEMESAAEHRHEYISGEIIAMAGGAMNHSRIIRNATTLIDTFLMGSDCELATADVRIQIEAAGAYTYPDLSVICGPIEYARGRNDTIKNPRLLIEVLSKSTQRYDRGDKFRRYRLISSLQEYLLISSTEMLVEQYNRTSTFQWEQTIYTAPDDIVSLESVGITIQVAALYRLVDFSAPDECFVAEP